MAKKTAKKSFISGAKLGHWVFLAGVIIAVVTALVIGQNDTVIWVLALLGLIVGLINVTLKDEVPFLVATTVLFIAFSFLTQMGIFSAMPLIGSSVALILYNITVFVAPAALIVALKAIYAFARE